MDVNQSFQQAIQETNSLFNFPEPDYKDVQICNVVSKVELLESKEQLCVYSLLQHASGIAKLAPKQPAAAILRIKDAISTTTCLIFHTGRMINVGAISKEHAR